MSYVEFLRDKEGLQDKWCSAEDVRGDIEKLRQLVLIEELTNCMPEELRVHLRDKKITTGYEFAAVTYEYVITHKRSRDRFAMKTQNDCWLKGVRDGEKRVNGRIKEETRNTLRREDKAIICHRYGKVGHITAKCHTGRGPETSRIHTEKPQGAVTTDIEIEETYRPFVGKGHIFGPKKEKIAVIILRDTGASQSILRKEKKCHVGREKSRRKK